MSRSSKGKLKKKIVYYIITKLITKSSFKVLKAYKKYINVFNKKVISILSKYYLIKY